MTRKTEKKNIRYETSATMTAEAINNNGQRVNEVYDDLLKEGCRINATRRHSASKAGLWAEHHHKANFNRAAIEAGRPDLRAVLAKPGNVTTDLHVLKDGVPIEAYQLKYHNTADASYEALRKPRYEKLKKVVPEEQLGDVQKLAEQVAKRKKPATSAARQRKSRTPAADEFTDRIEADGVKARAVSKKRVRECAENDVSGIRVEQTRAELKHTAKSALKVGAAVSAAVAVAQHGTRAIKGDESVGVALVNGACDVAVGTATTVATAVSAKVIEQQFMRLTARVASRTLSNGALAAASTIIHLLRLALAGKLKWRVAIEEIAIASAGVGGAELGAIIGSVICPGAGTLIGGIFGGIGGQFLLPKAIERARKKLAGRNRKPPHLAYYSDEAEKNDFDDGQLRAAA